MTSFMLSGADQTHDFAHAGHAGGTFQRVEFRDGQIGPGFPVHSDVSCLDSEHETLSGADCAAVKLLLNLEVVSK
jgi:hypothetical protein